MSFNVAADKYDSYMGRYSRLLAGPFAEFAGITANDRVLDVGAGPGALTTELVARVGADRVAAVDPSQPFVDALRDRHPNVAVQNASAEALPFDDDSFDCALAQLVVHFMDDAVSGLGEMRRVIRRGGTAAACVWDFTEGHGPLEPFWRLARDLDPEVDDESHRAGARRGHLEELLAAAGLREISGSELWIQTSHQSFDEWWAPFEAGVGPGGAYLAALTSEQRDALYDRARTTLPEGGITLRARAWAVRGTR